MLPESDSIVFKLPPTNAPSAIPVLLFAFGKCKQQHFSRYQKCDTFFTIFEDLKSQLDISHHIKLQEYQEQLKCYLAHQTRKAYLNAQFNSTLCELDNEGAVIIVDYKMRILPKMARETKSEFFGKRRWTLHTTLVFQKINSKIDI